ncbi:MAG: CBS domain-containing protein [Ardenticatenaceae bacterium]|nr:CBS domain-containing protein [Ardenticatenaceae bacterium]
MLLILTHENADFDAVASQLAAHKLYPQGIPLLSQRINRNVEQFLTLYWDVLPYMRRQDWQRKRVERVILVDTHGLNSVRGMVKQPEVQVIDHHITHQKRDKWQYHVEAMGAATTILVERLQEAGLILTPEEATLLLLGIYEDSGSLTYDTTTSRDVRAAAWLMEQGAQLAVVRKFMNIPLTAAQQKLYDALQTAVSYHHIHSQPIVITTAVAPPDFDEEISSVTHRLREALSAVGLFVLVQISADVQLVARSINDYVDVSIVAKALGGGGHDRAAAALVVGKKLAEVREQILALLPKAVKPMTAVAQIMSYGVRTLEPNLPINEAARLMQRFGYEGYPIVDNGQLIGLLTRRAVDRAMSHNLGYAPVKRFMRAGAVTVRPSDSIERVQQLMLNESWGQIPVIAEDSPNDSTPIGIVTRTDVLNFMFAPPPETAETNLRQLLTDALSPPLWAMINVVSETADALHMPLYFVGGPVRDLLLHQPATDLDLVVEGDAIKLARQLNQKHGGDIHTHARFGTAKWFLTAEIWQNLSPHPTILATLPETIDFVTARTEFYAEPSALPEVERGSIKLDLHRRDFTINTLAVRLDGAHLGELLDFYGGQRDLRQGIIRVLHSLSFIDDPTRMLRAVRLEQRLNFKIETNTADLITAALPMLDRVTGSRIRHELELTFREAEPAPVLARLAELNIMSHIHPALHWSAEIAQTFARVPDILSDEAWHEALQQDSPAFVYFALWLTPLSRHLQTEVMDRLGVRKTTRDDMAQCHRARGVLNDLPPDARPSEVEMALRPFRARALLVVRILLQDERKISLLEQYYREWQWVKTAVTGDDLRQIGLKPSPRYTIILDQILAARLDGAVTTATEEQELLAQLAAAS